MDSTRQSCTNFSWQRGGGGARQDLPIRLQLLYSGTPDRFRSRLRSRRAETFFDSSRSYRYNQPRVAPRLARLECSLLGGTHAELPQTAVIFSRYSLPPARGSDPKRM